MIDFIPIDYRKRRIRREFRVFENAILIFVILVLCLDIFLYFNLDNKKKRLADELEVASARLEIIDKRLDKLADQKISKNEIDWAEMMERLKELLPQKLVIDSFTIREDNSFEFRGQLTDSKEFFKFIDKISNFDYFQRVMIEHSLDNRETKKNLIKFKVRGEIVELGR